MWLTKLTKHGYWFSKKKKKQNKTKNKAWLLTIAWIKQLHGIYVIVWAKREFKKFKLQSVIWDIVYSNKV